MSTLNDRKAFDFEKFMRDFSQTIYPFVHLEYMVLSPGVSQQFLNGEYVRRLFHGRH